MTMVLLVVHFNIIFALMINEGKSSHSVPKLQTVFYTNLVIS